MIASPDVVNVLGKTLGIGSKVVLDDKIYRINQISHVKAGKHGSAKIICSLFEHIYSGVSRKTRKHVTSGDNTQFRPVFETLYGQVCAHTSSPRGVRVICKVHGHVDYYEEVEIYVERSPLTPIGEEIHYRQWRNLRQICKATKDHTSGEL